MVISGALAIIATTASIFGLVNTGANVAGTIHDKAMINDSIANMRETQQLLQQKALTSSENQAEMMTSAAKLQQVADRMTELNNQAYTSSLRNEVAGLAKGLVAGVGGVGKLGEVVTNAVGIGETAADQVIGNKSLSDTLGNAPMENWNAAAQAGDDLDVQILILQARQLANKAKSLNKEMAELNSWYGNEQPGNTDSTQLDNQIAELVDTNPDLAQQLTDTAVLANEGVGDNSSDTNSETTQVNNSDPKSGVGLDFLKDYHFQSVEIKMSYDLTNSNDTEYLSYKKKYNIDDKSFVRQWEAYGHGYEDLDITLIINPDDTVTGKMIGSAYVWDEDCIDLSLEGEFNPEDKTFFGNMKGKVLDDCGTSKGTHSWQTANDYAAWHLSTRNNPKLPIDKYFNFHGYVDEEQKMVKGYYNFGYFWRTMEGSY